MTIAPWSPELNDSEAKAIPEPLNAPTVDRKSWGIEVGAGGGGPAGAEDPLLDL